MVDTKNLDAILKFYDYALISEKPGFKNVIGEGPIGKYWNWIDEPLGKWKFTDPQYNELRYSGDKTKIASLTPQLSLTIKTKTWYPWWNSGKSRYGKGRSWWRLGEVCTRN